MNTAHKRLLILSLDKGVNKFLCNTIHNIIGSEVTVSGACINEIAGLPEYDLIMTSGENMLPLARKSFPGRPLIAPQRIITGYNLEKVLMLPKGTTVLVVNHPLCRRGNAQITERSGHHASELCAFLERA